MGLVVVSWRSTRGQIRYPSDGFRIGVVGITRLALEPAYFLVPRTSRRPFTSQHLSLSAIAVRRRNTGFRPTQLEPHVQSLQHRWASFRRRELPCSCYSPAEKPTNPIPTSSHRVPPQPPTTPTVPETTTESNPKEPRARNRKYPDWTKPTSRIRGRHFVGSPTRSLAGHPRPQADAENLLRSPLVAVHAPSGATARDRTNSSSRVREIHSEARTHALFAHALARHGDLCGWRTAPHAETGIGGKTRWRMERKKAKARKACSPPPPPPLLSSSSSRSQRCDKSSGSTFS